MLNYLSAELYRISRRRQYLALCGGVLSLVLLAAILWGDGDRTQALEFLEDFLVVGLYLCFPLSALTVGDLWRGGTLGNELAQGLPRRRIYLGKLLASLLAGVALLLLVLGVYLFTTLLLTDWGGGEEPAWAELGRAVLSALPRYIGALSLAHALTFTLRTSGMAPVIYYLYISVGELFLSAVRVSGVTPVGEWLNALAEAVRPGLITGGFFTYNTVPEIATGLLQSWLVGFGWLAVTTAVGLAVFARREIK